MLAGGGVFAGFIMGLGYPIPLPPSGQGDGEAKQPIPNGDGDGDGVTPKGLEAVLPHPLLGWG